MKRKWFRFRWWFARKVAPKGVHALLVTGGDYGNAVDLHASPARLWGWAHRIVPPAVGKKLEEIR